MKKTGLLFLTLAWMLYACQDKPAPQEKPAGQKVEKKTFFPVADYLKSEISYVDSLPGGILKYSTVGGKTDSVYIPSSEFDKLASEFLPPELTDSVFTREFSENSFIDQTTQAVTFTYEPVTPTQELRRVDILAAQGSGIDRVKSVYMEKTTNTGSTTVIKKMFWKAKRSFQVISISQTDNQPAVSSELRVVWDYRN